MTLVATLGISLASLYTLFQLSPTSADDFPQFLYGMLAIFFFAGVGNASTFKQMPMIFERRQAGGVIGWTSAIAAYGPFFFGVLLAFIAPDAVLRDGRVLRRGRRRDHLVVLRATGCREALLAVRRLLGLGPAVGERLDLLRGARRSAPPATARPSR